MSTHGPAEANSIHTNHRPRRERARAWDARGLVRLGSVLLFCDDCFLSPLIIPIPYRDWLFLLPIGSAALTSIGPLPRPRPMSWARALGRPGENPACLGIGGEAVVALEKEEEWGGRRQRRRSGQGDGTGARARRGAAALKGDGSGVRSAAASLPGTGERAGRC